MFILTNSVYQSFERGMEIESEMKNKINIFRSIHIAIDVLCFVVKPMRMGYRLKALIEMISEQILGVCFYRCKNMNASSRIHIPFGRRHCVLRWPFVMAQSF